jgi:hypothetical protein
MRRLCKGFATELRSGVDFQFNCLNSQDEKDWKLLFHHHVPMLPLFLVVRLRKSCGIMQIFDSGSLRRKVNS